MISADTVKKLSEKTDSKIVMLVIDGLGGLPDGETGKTELETARTPNLDRLAKMGECGLLDPVAPGITPGSAPGHLALFGYDPMSCQIGRGILEALGIDYELEPGDVVARGNFCTVNIEGNIIDRRAGRLSTERNVELCRRLDEIVIDGVDINVRTVKEHRLIVVFRGEGLSAEVTDTDPQKEGVPPKEASALSKEANKTAKVVNKYLDIVREKLSDVQLVNMILLRGFSQRPNYASMNEIYKLTPAAIASYPMYRGLASVVGMTVLPTGNTFEEEVTTLEQRYGEYDFFFIHAKETDTAGEDGDFNSKVAAIERIDKAIERITALKPDVFVVTGDHSTPALLKKHSWHPLPLLINSKWCRRDSINTFSEAACIDGGLGRIAAAQLMTLVMANALKLAKFGA